MKPELELTAKNLGRLAKLNGYHGVVDLAMEVGRNRVTLYSALHRPECYGPTIRALDRALPFRQVRPIRDGSTKHKHN